MSSPLVVDGLAAIAGWRIALLGAALLGAGAAIATAILVSATLLITQLLGGIPLEILIAILSLWFAIIGVMMYASYPVKNALVSEQADTASSGSLFGVIQAVSAIGSASSPTIFGVLTTEWGSWLRLRPLPS